MGTIDELFDKSKDLASKAEAFLDENIEKAKASETYAKITESMEKAGEMVEQKIEEFKASDIPGKLEDLRQKAEAKTDEVIDQAKAYGAKVADEVDQKIDEIKERLSGDRKTNS